MQSRNAGRSSETRRRVAIEAARLMSEHGIRDFRLAKQKAAERLNVRDESQLPKNGEIEMALREHQRLFQSDEQPLLLRCFREAARDAMTFFANFDPRLVGAVLDGTADVHSAICLHLFCDTPEDVIVLLQDNGIDFEERSRRLRMSRDTQVEMPVISLTHDGNRFDLTLFPRDAIRQAPLDRIDDRPIDRASRTALEQLLAAG